MVPVFIIWKKRNFSQGCYYLVKPAFIHFTRLLNYGKGDFVITLSGQGLLFIDR